MEENRKILLAIKPSQPQAKVYHCATDFVHRLKAFIVLFPLTLSVPLLTACISSKNLGIGTSQILAAPLPQDFAVPAEADRVFAIVNLKAESTKHCHVIAKSAKERLISWCERTEKWQDLNLDTVGVNSQGPVDQDFFNEMAKDTGKGVAIITVWVEDLGPKSRVHIRRVTYGDQSFAGMGHSRGEFERQLHTTIVQQL